MLIKQENEENELKNWFSNEFTENKREFIKQLIKNLAVKSINDFKFYSNHIKSYSCFFHEKYSRIENEKDITQNPNCKKKARINNKLCKTSN